MLIFSKWGSGMLKRWQKIGLSVFVVVAILFAASFLFSATYEVCSAPDNSQHQDCSTYHLGPAILAWTVSRADQHNGLVTAIATIIIACFTVALSVATIEQGRFAERALKINRQPFIFVDEFRQFFEVDPAVKQPEDPTKPRHVSGWAFRPFLRNSGETQTRNLITHVEYEFRESPLPINFKFLDNHAGTAPLMIGPKSSATGGSPRTFTIEEIEKVKKGERPLYMWGWIRYGDAFAPGLNRITRYCVQVLVIGDPSLSDCPFQWLVHLEGNCSDDECAAIGLG